MNNCVRIVSWNVNGLHNPIKRKKCLSYLKSQQAHIAFIQETHMTESEALKLKRDWVGQVFHSSYSSKKHGVAILIHKKLNFLVTKQQKDDEGRVIYLQVKINGVQVTLCNIYAPNEENPDFFHKLNKLVGNDGGCPMIIGGDFNQVLDGALDKTTFSNIVPKDRMAIGLLMEDMGLTDIWRLVNPRDREYTFYSHKHKSQSRIDYFLISKELVNNVTDCSIGPIALTDHAAVHLGVLIGSEGNRGGRWRMNVSMLQDPVFSSQLEKDISTFFWKI